VQGAAAAPRRWLRCSRSSPPRSRNKLDKSIGDAKNQKQELEQKLREMTRGQQPPEQQ
jgi:hypothetical protein